MKKLVLLLFALLTLGQANAQTCIGSAVITPNPAPFDSAGHYLNGTVVTFCVSITDYAQTGVDWLCGVVPVLGPGWDLSTLAPVSAAPSCDGQGNWSWYPTCTSTNSGLTFGPGFFYDTPAGATSGTLDGIPGNNYGDNCQNNTWTFCFQVMVDLNAPPLTDCSVSVSALPDNVCGSWGTAGCTDPDIQAPQPYSTLECTVTVPVVNTVDVACFGDNSGTAEVIPTSGFGPYAYLWSNGQTTASITGLTGGIYSVTVTDSVGCSKNIYVQIQSPPEIVFNPIVVNPGCSGPGGGSIVLNASGGVGPFTYVWSNGETTGSIYNLIAGAYDFTVTDSTGCTSSDTYFLFDTPPLTFNPATVTDETCGLANGQATVNVNTGFPPYNYTWTPNVSTTDYATNLSGGTYYVLVTDLSGCTAIDSIVVNSTATYTVASSVLTANCAGTGGSATVSVSGNSTPVTFVWSPNVSSDSVATNISAGTYTVIVTDGNGCSQTSTVVVPQLTSTVTISTPQIVQTGCDATAVANITVSGGGGTAPYTYQWSSGDLTDTATGVLSGTYTVTVTDANLCTATTSATVNPVIPVAVTLAQPVDATCAGNDGSASVSSVTGGTGTYTYSWSGGVSTPSITGLVPGTYTVTVTDGNGCSATGSVTVGSNSIGTPAISDVSAATTICAGASTSLSVTATPATSYTWSPATGLDDENSATPVASPAAGSTTTYTVTVTSGLCSSDTTVDVTVLPQVDAVASPATSEGTLPLTVNFTSASSGGTPSWDFGDGNIGTGSSINHEYTTEGEYNGYLVITNSLGCTDTAYFKVTVENNSTFIAYNVFTPDGSGGKNDVFKFVGTGIEEFNAQIYNRWGNKIYEWNSINGSWNGISKNGEVAPAGTYYYIVKARGKDAKVWDTKGTVTLIRSTQK